MDQGNSFTQITDCEPVKLTVTYSRSTLPLLSEDQLIYTLIELQPSLLIPQTVIPTVNLCLVIDCSTSMQGERIETVKRATIKLLRQLQPEDIFSIVSFNDRAEVLITATAGSEWQKAIGNLYSIFTSGGTEIHTGLDAGLTVMLRNSENAAINHLILLTDGQTYGDEDICLEIATQSANNGIDLTAVGIGYEWNDIFLDELTSKTGGNCLLISKPSELESMLISKIHSLKNIFAQSVVFKGITSNDSKLRYAFRLEPDESLIRTESPILLGMLPLDNKLAVLWEFIIAPLPSDSSQAPLIEGIFEIKTVNHSMLKIPVSLTCPITQGHIMETPPLEIIRALKQLVIYRLHEQARWEVNQGEYLSATQRLQRMATQLLSQGEHQLACTVLGEVEELEQTKTFSNEKTKVVKYGTRSLIPTKRTGMVL